MNNIINMSQQMDNIIKFFTLDNNPITYEKTLLYIERNNIDVIYTMSFNYNNTFDLKMILNIDIPNVVVTRPKYFHECVNMSIVDITDTIDTNNHKIFNFKIFKNGHILSNGNKTMKDFHKSIDKLTNVLKTITNDDLKIITDSINLELICAKCNLNINIEKDYEIYFDLIKKKI